MEETKIEEIETGIGIEIGTEIVIVIVIEEETKIETEIGIVIEEETEIEIGIVIVIVIGEETEIGTVIESVSQKIEVTGVEAKIDRVKSRDAAVDRKKDRMVVVVVVVLVVKIAMPKSGRDHETELATRNCP